MMLRFFIVFLFISSATYSHELKPSIADLKFFKTKESISASLSIQTNLEAIIANIDPSHKDTDQSKNSNFYNEIRGYEKEKLEKIFRTQVNDFNKNIYLKSESSKYSFVIDQIKIDDVGDKSVSRNSTLILKSSNIKSDILKFFWNEKFGPVVLRVTTINQEEGYTKYIKNNEQSDDFSVLEKDYLSVSKTVLNYLIVGFEHIVPKGLDHILFVLGLFLLSSRFRPLLIQITSFTVAHTATLFLSVLGIFTLPSSIVEPLIALSISYVAIENIFLNRISIWRPFLVFGFGLLHGMGFAGVLKEVGLSQNNLIVSLLSFNVGVELGQISVILVSYILIAHWFKNKSWYRERLTKPLSILIAIIGLYWFVERALL